MNVLKKTAITIGLSLAMLGVSQLGFAQAKQTTPDSTAKNKNKIENYQPKKAVSSYKAKTTISNYQSDSTATKPGQSTGKPWDKYGKNVKTPDYYKKKAAQSRTKNSPK